MASLVDLLGYVVNPPPGDGSLTAVGDQIGPAVVTATWRSGATRTDLPFYSPADFGAAGDNVTDDSAAWARLVARINAQSSQGALIQLPPGFRSKCFTGVNFDNMTGIQIRGNGGADGSTSSSSIWTGRNDGGPAISAKSSLGFTVEGVYVLHNGSTAVPATAIDLTSAQFPDLRRCEVTAQQVGGTVVDLVTLKNAISVKLDHTLFAGGRYNIQGRSIVGDFLNGLDITACTFQTADLCAIHNLGTGTEIHGGTIFEPLRGLACGAILQDSTIPAQGLDMHGIWSGDNTASGTLMILNGTGISLRGSRLDGSTGTGTAIQFNGAASGVEIKANDIRNWTLGFDKNGQAVVAEIGPNAYSSVATRHNFTPAGTLYVEA